MRVDVKYVMRADIARANREVIGMECLNGIRECPNGWTDCNLCAFYQACLTGTYVPEPEPESTELEEHELTEDLGLPIVEDKPKQRMLSPSERFWDYMQNPTPGLHVIADPYKAMEGAFVPGGSKSGKSRKKPKKKMPEYLKTWGT